MSEIAGHRFTGLNGRCSCGKVLGDIAGATREHLNAPGFAHSGGLIERELNEIHAEVARIWALVVGSATGNGPAANGLEPATSDGVTAWPWH